MYRLEVTSTKKKIYLVRGYQLARGCAGRNATVMTAANPYYFPEVISTSTVLCLRLATKVSKTQRRSKRVKRS